ncbi:hypothetical protein IK112_00825 [Candidatus Saccharibacteria bacterium]|nr:hypothetical protein [Candidatus Saccharibacteria bacterium]
MFVLAKLRWKLYDFYSRQLLLWGLKRGYIQTYSEEVIEKLRDIYYGGVPASVLLLCNAITDGHCYDRALLMSRAFLDGNDDVNLVYAEVADLKFNPDNKDGSGDHCAVERITENGKRLIYDTSAGFVYEKWIYWLINFPKVRLVRTKNEIIKFLEGEESGASSEDPVYAGRNFVLSLIIPNIEATYGRKGEMYSLSGIELLQREVEIFKNRTISKSPS